MSGSREDGGRWATHEIVYHGEVDLLGSHCRGLGMRGKKGFTKGIIYWRITVYSHGVYSAPS